MTVSLNLSSFHVFKHRLLKEHRKVLLTFFHNRKLYNYTTSSAYARDDGVECSTRLKSLDVSMVYCIGAQMGGGERSKDCINSSAVIRF